MDRGRAPGTEHLIDQGMSADEAEALATEALKGPARVPIPTIAELEAILQQHEDDKPVTIHGDGSITTD